VRILHVNKFLYRRGGAEGYMQDVAELQAGAGHDVAFFGMRHELNDPQHYADAFPSHMEFEPPPPDAAGKARAFGRMLWSRSAERGIARVVDDFRPDVVHLHNIYHQLSPSVLRPLAARGIPAVMTLHDYKLACPTYQFLDNGSLCQACLTGGLAQAVKRRCRNGSLAASAAAVVEVGLHRWFGAYDSVRLFLCPSRFLADSMRAAGLATDRLRVLDNFTDTASVVPQRAPGSGLVFAGRLSAEKGVDVLVRAVGRLEEATLDVAGDGPERERLEALAAQTAPGRVRFHGRLPKDRLLDLLRGGSVSVVPSRWHENQPLAVLEAFSCGLPVVTTGLGGLPELVEPGVDGVIVGHDDPAALAEGLRPLLADPGRCHRMGRAARAKAELRFSPAGHLDRLMEHYDHAAARPVAGRTIA
jgi:glycosyltransferase involved in cell wall biosynthesis